MRRVLDLMSRSFCIVDNAGAAVAEDIAAKKLKSDIGTLAIHFRFIGQFLGFSKSSGPSHVTYFIGSQLPMNRVLINFELASI